MFSTLLRRDGVYYLRRVVPKSLRETLGQREVKISLKTRNVEEAKRRLKVESLRVDRLFEEARRSLVSPDARVYRLVQETLEDHRRRPRER